MTNIALIPSDDTELARLLEEVSQGPAADEAIDVELYRSRFPQCADELRKLVPLLEQLAGLGRSGRQFGRSAEPEWR